MRQVIITALVLISFASAQPISQDPVTSEAFSLSFSVLGNQIRFLISEKDLDDSPEWRDPESSTAPFSVSDAIRVSRTELGRYGVDRPESWYVSQVTIHRFHERAHWFYIVEWRPRKRAIGDGLSIPVLMNGRAVVGEVEREIEGAAKKSTKSVAVVSQAAGSTELCEYEGDLLRRNGRVVRYSSTSMKQRAVHKVEVGGLTAHQADISAVTLAIDVVVLPNGKVGCASVRNGHPIIRSDVENAIRQWRFKPAMGSGKPVAYLGQLRFYLCRMSCGTNGESVTLLR